MVTAEFLPTVVSKLQGTTVSPLVIYSIVETERGSWSEPSFRSLPPQLCRLRVHLPILTIKQLPILPYPQGLAGP